MSHPVYICPDCDGRVLHDCRPPSYWRGRRLPRFPGLRRLRRVQLPEVADVDREEIHAKAFYSMQDALGPGATLRPVDEETP